MSIYNIATGDLFRFADDVCDIVNSKYGELYLRVEDAYTVGRDRLVLDLVDDSNDTSISINVDADDIESIDDLYDYLDNAVKEVEFNLNPENREVESSTEVLGYEDIPEGTIDTYDVSEEIEIDIDIVVNIFDDGSIEYVDETYSWAKPENGATWYSEDGVYLGTAFDMVEHIDELLYNELPELPAGTYKITGWASLAFKIEDLFEDNYGDTVSDEADVTYIPEASSIGNVQFERI